MRRTAGREPASEVIAVCVAAGLMPVATVVTHGPPLTVPAHPYNAPLPGSVRYQRKAVSSAAQVPACTATRTPSSELGVNPHIARNIATDARPNKEKRRNAGQPRCQFHWRRCAAYPTVMPSTPMIATRELIAVPTARMRAAAHPGSHHREWRIVAGSSGCGFPAGILSLWWFPVGSAGGSVFRCKYGIDDALRVTHP